MSSVSDTNRTDTDEANHSATEKPEELAVENELLREQNRRLREEYLRSQQQTYRQSALGLLVVGLIAVGAGIVFPATRTVLIALGGTGVFASILTYTLTPERFLAENVSEGVYTALVEDRTSLLTELAIQGEGVYVPAERPQLYIPAEPSGRQTELPQLPEELSALFVATDDGTPGVALTPTGRPLFVEFERSLTGSLAEAPAPLMAQLTDGLVEGFGLVDGVETDVDATGGRVTVELTGVAYGAVDQIDHPVCSLLATGLAVGLDKPIRVEVEQTEPALVTYRWDQDEEADVSNAG